MKSPLTMGIVLLAASTLLGAADFSQQPYVIEQFTRDFHFHSDGTWTCEQSARVRIQSAAAARQFGVLSFEFTGDSQQLAVEQVRVEHRDGSTVETPAGSAHETATAVSLDAPMYSSEREKQIPVKGLQPGSVLEYRVRLFQRKPEPAGHFWYTGDFIHSGTVLHQTLRAAFPRDKYVQVASATVQPAIIEANGERVYTWNTSSGEVEADQHSDTPDVRITTFHNWAEVGEWFADAVANRAIVTPAIQKKADELTRGLKTPESRARALYGYVSGNFRYISVSLGAARLQPHTPAEVLENQYGDCKDKHTLLAALLKAEGIEAYPVLVASKTNLDEQVPSPADFDHVITAIRNNSQIEFVDTTPEVAPYGVLQQHLRGRKALLVSANQPARLLTLPDALPFHSFEAVDVDATLTETGTLRAHYDVQFRGDEELTLRRCFHESAPAAWSELVQKLVNDTGLTGKVSEVQVENADDATEALRFGFEYEQAKDSNWDKRRITAPPAIAIDSVNLTYHAVIHLPEGMGAALPEPVHVQSASVNYESSYSQENGTLAITRVLNRNSSDILAELKAAIDNDENASAEITPDYRAVYALMQSKQYAEAVRILGTLPPDATDDAKMLLAEALLRSGKTEEGSELARQTAEATTDPEVWNNIAYMLADTGTALDNARQIAAKCVQAVSSEQPRNSERVAAALDTLGWIYFKSGDAKQAVPLIEASYKLGKHAAVAEHLQQARAASQAGG